jgi:hypothetical protein
MSTDNGQVTPEVKEVKPEKTEIKEEKTIGELLQGESKKETPKSEFTPADFMAVKSKNKELARTVKELQEKIAEGAKSSDIDSDVDAILAEFPDVDKKFIQLVTKQAKEAARAEMEEKFAPIEADRKATEFKKVFNKFYKDALDKMPEYAEIVNKEVIMSLAGHKANANKTIPQIIEETYGNAIGGKRTIETTVPRGGKDPVGVDFQRATRDTAYFKEIMANPDLKKEYNAGLLKRIIR